MLILIALALLLYFIDHRFQTFANLRTNATFVVASMQNIINSPLVWYQELIVNLKNKKSIVKENAKFRSQLLQANVELQRLHFIEHENTELRHLLHYSKRGKQHIIAAQILTAANYGFGQTIINRGIQHRVYVGQPVVDPYGVLGRVIKVNPTMSTIMLLTHKQSAIPAIIMRNGLRVIVVGTGKDYLEVINIPETADIQINDLLVASGLEKIFPAGYQVGVVKMITKTTGERFVRVIVTPQAHLNNALHVFLLQLAK